MAEVNNASGGKLELRGGKSQVPYETLVSIQFYPKLNTYAHN